MFLTGEPVYGESLVGMTLTKEGTVIGGGGGVGSRERHDVVIKDEGGSGVSGRLPNFPIKPIDLFSLTKGSCSKSNLAWRSCNVLDPSLGLPDSACASEARVKQ